MSCWTPPELNLNSWHSGHEFPSSMWVAGHLSSSIWMADILAINSHPACELLSTPELNLSGWSNLHLGCELLGTFWGQLEWLKSCYEFPSRMWVAPNFFTLIDIPNSSLWNVVQFVAAFILLPLNNSQTSHLTAWSCSAWCQSPIQSKPFHPFTLAPLIELDSYRSLLCMLLLVCYTLVFSW